MFGEFGKLGAGMQARKLHVFEAFEKQILLSSKTKITKRETL